MWSRAVEKSGLYPYFRVTRYIMHTQLIYTALPLPVPAMPRTPGMHVSTLIKHRAVRMGYLKNIPIEEFDLVDASQQEWWDGLDETAQLRISIGLAWEDWYLPQLSGVIYHPGEMSVDGIFMTHDGESIDVIAGQSQIALHEVKATYKSINTVGDLTTQWMWLAQTKAYCKGLDTLRAYLHILYLCGDYKFPIAPRRQVWRITYSPLEIEASWDELREEYQYMRTNATAPLL